MTFLHGAGSRGEVWQLQGLAFPQAVIPSLAGRDGRDPPRSVAAHVVALQAALEGTVLLVGHSLGAAVALEYALTGSSRLVGLVLVGAAASLRVRPDWLARLRAQDETVLPELVDAFFAADAPARLRDKTLRQLQALDPAVVLADFEAAEGFDARRRLGGVLVPTLVVCGTLDQMTPARRAEALHAALPRSELVLIEGRGHMVMLEDPQAVNRAIRDFCSRL